MTHYEKRGDELFYCMTMTGGGSERPGYCDKFNQETHKKGKVLAWIYNIASEKQSPNELTYSFIVSYLWGLGWSRRGRNSMNNPYRNLIGFDRISVDFTM